MSWLTNICSDCCISYWAISLISFLIFHLFVQHKYGVKAMQADVARVKYITDYDMPCDGEGQEGNGGWAGKGNGSAREVHCPCRAQGDSACPSYDHA